MATIIYQESGSDATRGLEFYSSTVGTVASDNTISHTGACSIKHSSGNPAAAARCRRSGVLADAGRRINIWFRFDTLPGSANASFIGLETSGGTTIAVCDVNTDGTVKIRPVGATSVSGSTVLAVNTWYRATFCYTITNTTTFRFDLYIDGVLEASATAGTLTNTGTAQYRSGPGDGSWGINTNIWVDDVYIDDGTDYADPGDIRVTSKRPNAENLTDFDTAVGAARGASDYNSVNERPLSETNGWEQRGVAWVANGALAANNTTTTLAITGPACSVNDLLLAFIYSNDNQVVSPPDGTWTSIKEVNHGTGIRVSIFWKRATASGGTFNFTKPTDNNLLFAGFIGAWKGVRAVSNPIDATAPSQSLNASSDTVTYADFDPTETNAFLIAAGFYGNDLTTAGAMSGTDPTFTNRADLETSTGADCSIFVYDGVSSGAATGSRTHSTTSTADAANVGIIFGLVPQAQENYTLEDAATGDVNITGNTILGRTAWVWAKASDTTGSPTAAIVDNGGTSSITLTTSSALYTAITTSASYPSNAAGIGLRSTGTVNDTFLYECGTLISYIPASGGVKDIIMMGIIPFSRS